MKSKINFLFIVILAIFGLSSCSFETDKVDGDNDFKGFWHLESVETLSTDSASETVTHDYSKGRVFWAFQRKLLEIRDYDDYSIPTLFCRFNIANGKITITEAYRYSDIEQQDIPVSDDSILIHYGIPTLNTTYDYSIDGGKMVLSTDKIRLHLRKF